MHLSRYEKVSEKVTDCIFCKIASGDLPSKKVYEDDDVLAFYDVYPAAPTHVLIIPKKHIPSILEVGEEDILLIGKIGLTIKKIAQQLGLQKTGFRIVNNTGEYGGQTVYHIHFHLLGGRKLGWPPG